MKNQALAASIAALIGLTGCSATGAGNGFDDAGGTGAATGAGGSTFSSGTGGDASVGSGGSTASGGPNNMMAEVYGESADTLYRVDPDTKAVSVIGDFNGCYSVIDIALDKDSNMIATTSDGLYRVDKQTAVCTLIQSGSYPNSLSFVPEGTVDPTHESLVGYLDSEYVRIDTSSGAISHIGSLSDGYTSSGDIVSVKNGKTLLTVKGPSCDDCIVEVNPATGDLVKNWGPLPYSDVFGLAFWAGTAYAFDDGGQLFEVTFQSSLQTTPITIPSAPAGLSFWGAGSTTHAPPVQPPN